MRLLKFGKFIYHFLLNFLIHLDERTGTKRTHLTRQQDCLPKCPSCKISLRSYLDWTLIVHEEGQFVFFMFTFWLRSKDSFFFSMFTRWSVYMKGRKMCRSLASFGSGEEMKLHFTINKGKKWFPQRLESRIIMMLTSGTLIWNRMLTAKHQRLNAN